MQKLTIIIPLFRGVENLAFEETLASVLENRPSQSEILVVSPDEYSDPWDIVSEGVRFFSAPEESSPLRLLNRAIAESNAPIIHILSCGSTVTENWADPALARFENENIGCVTPLIFDRERPNRILSSGYSWHRGGKINLLKSATPFSKRFSVVAPDVASAFYRKSALDEIQGFTPGFMQQIAYIDASLLLSELAWETVQESGTYVFLSKSQMCQFSDFSWNKQSEQLFLRWLDWGGITQSFISHLFSLSCEVLRAFPRPKIFSILLGHFSGISHFGSHQIRISKVLEMIENNEHTRLEAEKSEQEVSIPFTSIRSRHLTDAA